MDSATTIATIKQNIANFVAERNWEVHHNPKNLCMAMGVEVSELTEHFQWLTLDQSTTYCNDHQKREAVEDEIADVASYLFELCNILKVDLSEAMAKKHIKNIAKYPIGKKPSSL